MSFSFDYISQEEDAKRNLLDDGDYEFTLVDIKPSLSKDGKTMTQVKLEIEYMNKKRTIFDNFTDDENMRWKKRHFMYSIGLHNQYEQKQPVSYNTMLGKRGFVKIKIKEQVGYPTRNNVVDYLVGGKSSQNLFDDDIKF